ncbi:hypothetical protein [Sphingobium aromaticiconvertens]|uniref:hypothetical protein n=1 Tax=Sphingobium aromaticiconvertens TaxID=365341 RepID=UPI003019A6D5
MMLDVQPAEVHALQGGRHILGVPYESGIRYPAVQFVDGKPLRNLDRMLQALGDMNPWEQLMLLTTPLEGYDEQPQTVLQLLAKQPDTDRLHQLTALLSSWAA